MYNTREKLYFVKLFLFIVLVITANSRIHSQTIIETETGAVFSVYNDVRIPNETGTEVSFTNDLSTEVKLFYRVRINRTIDRKHTISFLFAPLTLNSEGTLGKPVSFKGKVFQENMPIKAKYRFDSY